MAQGMDEWRTGLSAVRGGADDEISVRGQALASLIERFDFGQMTYFLLTGREPTAAQGRVVNALLVAAMEHGISPPAMVSRCFASYGTTLQAAIAGGVLSFGDIMGGAGEALARCFDSVTAGLVGRGVGDAALESMAREIVAQHRAQGRRVPGFGIPLHTQDPRTPALLKVASEGGLLGVNCRLLMAVEVEIEKSTQRRIPANLDGIGAALVLDMGLPVAATRMFIITPRTVSMTAHFLEEQAQGTAWRHVDESRIISEPPRNGN